MSNVRTLFKGVILVLYYAHRLRLYFCIPSSIERLYVLSRAVF